MKNDKQKEIDDTHQLLVPFCQTIEEILSIGLKGVSNIALLVYQ